MKNLASTLLLGAAFLAGGCAALRTPSDETRPAQEEAQPRSATGERWDDDDLYYYPEAAGVVERAEAASASGDHEAAVELADAAREALNKAIAARTDPRSDEVQSRARVSVRICLVKILAFRNEGRDIDALIEANWRPHSVIDARGARQDVWQEQVAELRALFRQAVIERGGSMALRPVGVVRKGLNDMYINAVRKSVFDGWHAIDVEPTSLLGEDDTIALRVQGEARRGTYDDCVKQGKAYALGTEFIVKRCTKKGYVARRADFVVHIPREDARRLSGKKQQRVTVLIQSENWKKRGRVHDAGLGRVAAVRTL